LKATWLGHASFFVELPARAAAEDAERIPGRGPRILFDPIFSKRCSPVKLPGFDRFTRQFYLVLSSSAKLILLQHPHVLLKTFPKLTLW